MGKKELLIKARNEEFTERTIDIQDEYREELTDDESSSEDSMEVFNKLSDTSWYVHKELKEYCKNTGRKENIDLDNIFNYIKYTLENT